MIDNAPNNPSPKPVPMLVLADSASATDSTPTFSPR